MSGRYGVALSVIVAAFGAGVWVGGATVAAQRTNRVLEVRRYTANRESSTRCSNGCGEERRSCSRSTA
jgi:hypothetical protein